MSVIISLREIILNSTVSKTDKILEIEKIRESGLFLSRYNRMTAMDGKNTTDLSPEDLSLATNYAQEEMDNKFSAIPHYKVSIDSLGIVTVQMRTPDELIELLIGEKVQLLSEDEISNLLTAWEHGAK